MDYLIKIIFVVLIAVYGLVMNMNLSTSARSTKYLKEDLEIAVHDAALFQDQQKLANGEFVFDKNKAEQEFKNSFKQNTGLTDSEFKIIEFKIFDQSNSTFPVTYKATNVKFEDVFSSPTIVAVIETTVNKYFTGGYSEETVRRVASYSYKVNLDQSVDTTTSIIEGLKTNEKGLVWAVPFTKNITSQFSPDRVHPITGRVESHKGIDISASGVENQPAVAVRDGKIAYAGVINGYGNIVIVDHGNGFETRYAHLNSIKVTTNQKVKTGQVVGLIGSTGDSTGPHLHFETRVNGVPIDPLNFYK
ncbi:M23 family metallopeptidase [Heyndrickxia sporothermodurans]|uniref:M23 family metallopeptidase n=3 Tax=Heyndrickxia sporothermodurans TaxID=46224 RepID=A0AB37HKK0_9BACI|nr:M23 family metallopeptidase [Heyndrickxia sporothermodurans]MBL5768431.1 M23 family metallopeptidase [Heyndrickxia sporothermodurans]MBL5772089.1 M23 family metallopeptidase [Heyndrickxia sporothermodurans]MBL5776185.1 M23 family metallopeptidase [Heyndrickxia sporothermodurans]MBL5779334.1 M23 family metallopeptidase [Heyndrickxia sporothermodurans]MBL5783376.1 M23 family metallopeptidase [Heyndrickxia sporothermodurans]